MARKKPMDKDGNASSSDASFSDVANVKRGVQS
jgi:hypothetical protein